MVRTPVPPHFPQLPDPLQKEQAGAAREPSTIDYSLRLWRLARQPRASLPALVEHSRHPAIRRPGIAPAGRGVAVEIEDQYVAFPDGLAIKGLMDRYAIN